MVEEVGRGVVQMSIDPKHQRLWRMNRAPRCGARTRGGSPCRSPAVKGKIRCRMHGGAKGSGGPEGPRNGNWRHGLRSRETIAVRTIGRMLLRLAKAELGDE
jgi:hypothetical protein